MKDNKEPFSIFSRLKSFQYAFAGLRTLFVEEHNAWIHFFAAIVTITLGFIYHISSSEWIALTVAIGFVLVLEAINTAIEELADFVSSEKHPRIKKVKDLSAAAVLISSVAALVVGCIIFLPKFFNL